jgi:hypothetical protein
MIRLSPSGVREAVDRIPTTDLYFLNPITELKREGADIPTPRFLAQNVYLVGSTGVIVRYGSPRDIARLGRAGAKRIVYIADDDLLPAAPMQRCRNAIVCGCGNLPRGIGRESRMPPMSSSFPGRSSLRPLARRRA